MKNILLFLVLIALTVACQRDESIGPPELLHQRWHLSKTRAVNTNAWISYDTDGIYDTEYRPDGALVHRKDGIVQARQCCSANKFERDGARIYYSDLTICPFVRCSGPQAEATITILSGQLLELTTDQRVTQYVAIR